MTNAALDLGQERDIPRTTPGITETNVGPIQYIDHPAHPAYPGGIKCPVALKVEYLLNKNKTIKGAKVKKDSRSRPIPEIDGGQIVYALPGGGRWVG